MRKIIIHRLILFVLPFYLHLAQGQSRNFAYAVTAVTNEINDWGALRKLDAHNGSFSSMLLNIKNNKNKGEFPVNNIAGNNDLASNGSIAAIAFDKKYNRLYYVAVNDDLLRYVDLLSMRTFNSGASFSKAGNYVFQASSPITRLVIAPDGLGYTITSGNRLIRFTTGDTPVLTDLGELIDNAINNEMSIHNLCSNQGGDMIADDAGNLYLLTASNRVYKIDIKTRVATFLALLSGLPARFATNGAAVDENGTLIVSSSIYTDASFLVDPETWKAIAPLEKHQLYGVADLASGNVLHKTKQPAVAFFNWSFSQPGKVKVFPNPVLFDQVNVQFNDLPTGSYTIELTNLFGKTLSQQRVMITRSAQTEVTHIPIITPQAFYYLKILNDRNIVVSVQKLAVERW